MTEGLDHLLEDCDELCLNDLRGLVQELLNPCDPSVRLIHQSRLRRGHVYRLQFRTSSGVQAFVVKRLTLAVARRDQLVANRWLPAVGLDRHGPPLLGAVAERNGQWAWHAYEDLGDWTLWESGPAHRRLKTADGSGALSSPASHPDPKRLQAAVELIAEVHSRFAGHALLGECRLEGGDLGMQFFKSSVGDAIRILESLRAPAVALSRERTALRDRLLERMRGLLAEEPYRARQMKEFGGPETLLHGDLRPHNVISPRENGLHVRLIDWDHAGVGPAGYDLSTFLWCLPAQDRLRALALYEKAAGRLGWSLPPRDELNLLFNTAECARLANFLIWPAIAAFEGQLDWAFDDLARCEKWFEDLEPVLPVEQKVEIS